MRFRLRGYWEDLDFKIFLTAFLQVMTTWHRSNSILNLFTSRSTSREEAVPILRLLAYTLTNLGSIHQLQHCSPHWQAGSHLVEAEEVVRQQAVPVVQILVQRLAEPAAGSRHSMPCNSDSHHTRHMDPDLHQRNTAHIGRYSQLGWPLRIHQVVQASGLMA